MIAHWLLAVRSIANRGDAVPPQVLVEYVDQFPRAARSFDHNDLQSLPAYFGPSFLGSLLSFFSCNWNESRNFLTSTFSLTPKTLITITW